VQKVVILVRLLLFATALAVLVIAASALALPNRTPPAQAAFPAADLHTGLVFDCLADGNLSVDLRWASSNTGPQWVDMSRFDNDFAGGFFNHGPLISGSSSLTWYGLEASTWYFVRVNTLTANGWYPSTTMSFFTPADCHSFNPPAVTAPGTSTCPGLSNSYLTGCVWSSRLDYGIFGLNEPVSFCYYVTQPADIRVIVVKPDNSTLLVTDGFSNATGACIGPFSSYFPLGERTIYLYGNGALLGESHFYVQ
jgi:hypothetical protein